MPTSIMQLVLIPNRLKRVVDREDFYFKNTFAEGRLILDASLIANEDTDSLMKIDAWRFYAILI